MRLRVDWQVNFGNLPRFILELDNPLETLSFRYMQKGTMYYAENDNFVDFFSYHGPGDGYGGVIFNLTMLDESVHTLRGPFSDRASNINGSHIRLRYPGKKQPCVEVAADYMWTRTTRHITLSLLESVPKEEPFHIICIAYLLDGWAPYPNWQDLNPGVSFQFIPSLSPTEIVKPHV